MLKKIQSVMPIERTGIYSDRKLQQKRGIRSD